MRGYHVKYVQEKLLDQLEKNNICQNPVAFYNVLVAWLQKYKNELNEKNVQVEALKQTINILCQLDPNVYIVSDCTEMVLKRKFKFLSENSARSVKELIICVTRVLEDMVLIEDDELICPRCGSNGEGGIQYWIHYEQSTHKKRIVLVCLSCDYHMTIEGAEDKDISPGVWIPANQQDLEEYRANLIKDTLV